MLKDTSVQRKLKIALVAAGECGVNTVNSMCAEGAADFCEYKKVLINTLGCSYSKYDAEIVVGEFSEKDKAHFSFTKDAAEAAVEKKDVIKSAFEDCDAVVIMCGLAGYTGVGVSAVAAGIAKRMGLFTVLVGILPFRFEGNKRLDNAEKGLEALSGIVDTVIVLDNEKIKFLNSDSKKIPPMSLCKGMDVLAYYARSAVDTIALFLSNENSSETASVLKNAGLLHTSVGRAKGNERVSIVFKAIRRCLLTDTVLDGSDAVFMRISMPDDFENGEFDELRSLTENVLASGATAFYEMCRNGGDEYLEVSVVSRKQK